MMLKLSIEHRRATEFGDDSLHVCYYVFIVYNPLILLMLFIKKYCYMKLLIDWAFKYYQ